jgi:hypothetical protein
MNGTARLSSETFRDVIDDDALERPLAPLMFPDVARHRSSNRTPDTLGDKCIIMHSHVLKRVYVACELRE